MWKGNLLFGMLWLLGPLFEAQVLAQGHVIDLKEASTSLAYTDFYISKVVDAREQSGPVGQVFKGITNRTVTAWLMPDLSTALSAYLLPQFQPGRQAVPIELHVKHLEVAEKIVLPIETGFIDMALYFYATDSLGPKLLYANYYRAQKSVKHDVTYTHAANVRQALHSCIEQFSQSNWQAVWRGEETFEQPTAHPFTAEVPGEAAAADSALVNDHLLIDLRPDQYAIRSIMSVVGQRSFNSHSLGLNYMVYQDFGKRWLFPVMLSVSRMVIAPALLESTPYTEIDLRLFQPGLSAMYQLMPGLMFYNHLQLPMGRESLRNDLSGFERSRFLIGLIHSHGLLYSPWKQGFTAGIGVVQRYYDSDVYRRDTGLRITLGYLF